MNLADLIVPATLAGTLLLGGGLATLLATRRAAAPVVRPPAAVRRRAARDAAIVEGIRLAVEMARVDHEVHALELGAIHDFLTSHVKRRDVPYAARMMRLALEAPRDEDAVSAAVRRLRALDPQQRRLVLQLLAYVARADGRLRPPEVAFLRRIGADVGLEEAEIEAELARDLPADPERSS